MSNWPESFTMTFVPLFIALDALGNLPFVITLSAAVPTHERRKMVHVAIIGATVVGLVFLLFGKFILYVLGIEVGSFAIAGGIVLLVLSVNYMLSERMVEVNEEDTVAIVPIGTPLLVGPATITTLLLLSNHFPMPVVLVSFILNMALSWVIFLSSGQVMRLLGQGGLRVVSRVFDLLLAALAVSMIVRGLELAGIVRISG